MLTQSTAETPSSRFRMQLNSAELEALQAAVESTRLKKDRGSARCSAKICAAGARFLCYPPLLLLRLRTKYD